MNMTGQSYEVVRKALLETDGDVDRAIQIINDSYKNIFDEGAKDAKNAFSNVGDKFDNFAKDVQNAIEDIWKKGNASRLVVEKNGSTILNLSLAISAVGVILGPVSALVGAGAALLTDYDFYIILDDGERIDIKKYIADKKDEVFNKKHEDVNSNSEDDIEIIDEDEEK